MARAGAASSREAVLLRGFLDVVELSCLWRARLKSSTSFTALKVIDRNSSELRDLLRTRVLSPKGIRSIVELINKSLCGRISNSEDINPREEYEMEVVEIDGSLLEGGGQVLRNCASYAAILSKRAHIVKIRANRSKPGLRPQALAGLKLLANLCQGTLVGAFENSQEILFTPGEPLADTTIPRSYEADVKTAGSCSLLLQVSLPVLLFASTSTSLVLKGGTNVSNSPPIDHMKHVLMPVLQRHCNVNVELEVLRRGFMPRGGGVVHVKVHPQEGLPPIRMLERGDVVQVVAILFGYGLVAQPFIDAVKAAVEGGLNRIHVDFVSDLAGRETKEKLACGLFLYARTSRGCLLGGSAFGKRTDAPERLAKAAVQDLEEQLAHGGCTDEHLQDQLIIFMALADGDSEVMTGPISLHTETAIHFAHHMTQAKISVTPVPGTERNVIRCRGVGYSPPWVGRAR